MTDPKPGDAVSFFNAWKRQRNIGLVIDVRQSERHPWRVAVVQSPDGTETEVHPDRLETVQA